MAKYEYTVCVNIGEAFHYELYRDIEKINNLAAAGRQNHSTMGALTLAYNIKKCIEIL